MCLDNNIDLDFVFKSFWNMKYFFFFGVLLVEWMDEGIFGERSGKFIMVL